MTGFHIRPYEPADLDAVWALNDANTPAVGSNTPDQLAHIAGASLLALVVEHPAEDVLAGFAFVLGPGADYWSDNYAWFSERYADFVYLDRVAFGQGFRRRGLGRALYDEIAHRAPVARPGATHWTLEVNLRPRNDDSLAFHAAMGFEEVGQRESNKGILVSMQAKPLAP